MTNERSANLGLSTCQTDKTPAKWIKSSNKKILNISSKLIKK